MSCNKYLLVVESDSDGLELSLNANSFFCIEQYLENNPLPYEELTLKCVGSERSDDEMIPEGQMRRELRISFETFGEIMKSVRMSF